MATVTSVDTLRFMPSAFMFEGGELAPVSMIVGEFSEAGMGPPVHAHAYPEVFLVESGAGVWTAGDAEIEVTAGHIVTVPAETTHTFRSLAGEMLRVVSVQPSPTVVMCEGAGGGAPVVTPIESLRLSRTALRFEGREDAPISMFITDYPDEGQGPDLHLHPYPEVFLVEGGTGVWTAGEEQIEVTTGHIVTVPAETPHGFKNAGEGPLRVVSVHPSPTVVQTDL